MTAAIAAPPQTITNRGIGASLAAAAIGCSDYSAPVDAWLKVTGRVEFEGNKATKWGHLLEGAIRKNYVDTHGVSVYVPPESLFHPELPFVRATPDGIVVDAHGGWLYVGPQVKNVGLRMAPLWADGATPQDYLVQGVVEMAVTNLPRIDFAVLIGGQDDREVTVWRDEELEADVLEALHEFWGFVERDEQPPITGSRALRSHLIKQIKRRGVLEATPSDVLTIERWRDVAREMKRLKAEEAALKNAVLTVFAARGGDKLNTPLGSIGMTGPRRKTKWKEVAHQLAPTLDTLAGLEREIEKLRCDEVADTGVAMVLVEQLDAISAALRLVGAGNTFASLIATHTTVGEPSPRRPNDWTKGLDEEDDTDE